MKNPISAIKFILLGLLVLLASCDRGGDGVPEVDPDFVETDDPNRFLQFLNPQNGLPAGKYRIVAGTQSLGASGSFTITVTRDDGAVQTFNGSWSASGGMDTDDVSSGAANPSFVYIMPYSGGARFAIASSVATCLYLLDAGDTVLVGKRDIGGPDENLCTHATTIDMPKSKINLEANAKAYYRAIDPDNTRTTLSGWMAANGFGTPCPVSIPDCEHHVIFRDTKDLGYGRDMRARKNEDGSFAVFVRNFRVDALPGLQYSTLNLQAAIANNMDPSMLSNIQWHFGSNAIEFSPYPYGPGEPREGEIPAFSTNDGDAPFFTKYYTFKPDDVNDPNTTERRLDLVNLDGRGDISMPGPCIACHGGTSRPLLPNGDFPAPIPGGVPGDTQAQMQVIEVSTVTFSDTPGWTCRDIIDGVHFINQGVLDTYAKVGEQYGGVPGYWQPEFAAELIKGWYGDTLSAESPNDFMIEPAPGDAGYDPADQCNYLTTNFYDYIPQGWRPNPNTGMPPAGADDLFREVIAPNCMVCHSRRGTNLGPNNNAAGLGQDIDFSTYEKFISHAEQIERFIYHKGVMPLGLLNFDAFWDNSNINGSGLGRAELLAAHLQNVVPDFDGLNADGSAKRPGRPIAVAAAPRNTNVPAIFSAEGSSFAGTYQWSIVTSPVGSTPTLGNAASARVTFNTDQNGEYQLQLVARNGGSSDTVTFNVSVSSALPLPEDLRFETGGGHIKEVLQNPPADCVSCHAPQGFPGTPIEGVPVFYVDNIDQPEGRELYLEVLQRINFKEPIESPLLRKPSGNHHYGNVRAGFNLDGGDRSNYDLFLNWILQGAPR